jgi:hypothetical protein
MAEAMLSANELMIKAVRDFDHDALVRMLSQGVFADTRQWDDGTALHVCAETDNYEAMAILLAQRRAPNINAQNRVRPDPSIVS